MTRLILFSVMTFCAGLVSSCNTTENKAKEPVESRKCEYQCPVKCTEEIFERPGKCPVCKVNVIEIIKG